MFGETEKAYGCIFCMSGKENYVAEYIAASCPEVRLLPVRKEKYKSQQGKKWRVIDIALPGYVFFEAPNRVNAIAAFPRHSMIRVLTYQDQDWRLRADDARFAHWVFSSGGLLSFSLAHKEGDRVRIVSGPLKELEGNIRRVDKHGCAGQVMLEVGGRIVSVWLGFELIG